MFEHNQMTGCKKDSKFSHLLVSYGAENKQEKKQESMSFAYWCEEQFTLVPWPGSLWKLYRHWQSQKPSHQPWAKGKEGSNDQHYIIKEANKEINQLKCCLEDYTEMEIVKKTSWEHYPKAVRPCFLSRRVEDWLGIVDLTCKQVEERYQIQVCCIG